MNLDCIGISHHSAPLELREKLWFSTEEICKALPIFRAKGFRECVLFSTCNRTELYAFSDAPESQSDLLTRILLEQKGTPQDINSEHLFMYHGNKSVEHLFRVSSGIDSMVIGDVQILSQIKEGFQLAKQNETVGFFMHKLFQSASRVGKRTRNETKISEGAVSISYAAVELAERIFESLSEKRALVIGAGETAQLTAKHLKSRGIGKIFITNRTRERADMLAKEIGGFVIPFDDFSSHLSNIDILISSVQSDGFILTKDEIRSINKKRTASTLFIIDIGVPRNIDPSTREVEGIFLYDIDALQAMISENIQRRLEEVPKIDTIIEEQLSEFSSWYGSLNVTPTIAALREHFEKIRYEEVERNINRFATHERELVEILTKRILNKILHTPTLILKENNDQPSSLNIGKISAIRELFGIDKNSIQQTNEEQTNNNRNSRK